jgi:superfamily I DNA/RNA helicase
LLKFLEATHIKDVLAFLRWAENPRDPVAGFRVIQLLPGVGPATLDGFKAALALSVFRAHYRVVHRRTWRITWK